MKTPLFPKLAASVFITLIALFTGPSISQAKRDIEGQVFIVTKGSDNVKLGLVPIWVLGDGKMKAAAKQAIELANAVSQKQKVEQAVKDLRELEAKAEKELSSAGAQKVKAASSEEMQALLKSLEPISALAERGGKLLEKIDKQKRGIDSGEIFSRVMLGSELAVKMLIGMLSERESDVESDADGKFKLSVENSGGWVVAYSQRTVGRVGQLDLQNLEQYYWVVELPQKKAQLFLSSHNCDLSEAEVRLRSLAFEGERGGIFGAFKGPAKAPSGPVANTGNTQKVYDEEKREQDRIKAEKERIAAAEKAEKERIAAAEKAEKERIAAAEKAEKERIVVAEAKMRNAKALAEGKLLMDEDGRSLPLIPRGSFQMGSNSYADEMPVRQVSVAAFFMGETEVTFGEWTSVLRWAKANGYAFANEGKGPSDKHPVTSVSWYDAVKWCNAKSEMEGLVPCYKASGNIYRKGQEDKVACDWEVSGYRLPTEAEWEKAARGGLVGKEFPNGDALGKMDANFDGGGTVEVGKYPANGYGLHDMAGNVTEWCWNWYGTSDSGGSDPRGSATGSDRVLRGGDWSNRANSARSAYRNSYYTTAASNFCGFRVARGRP